MKSIEKTPSIHVARSLAVKLRPYGISHTDVAKVLEVSPHTVRAWWAHDTMGTYKAKNGSSISSQIVVK